ncbi:hypothetical protein [Streptomyces sp. NPDC059566]|uniref:hypothetical protein n=1 Tax=unclassified Streptomyces TaxID=2593676 RepID=UPI0036A7E067
MTPCSAGLLGAEQFSPARPRHGEREALALSILTIAVIFTSDLNLWALAGAAGGLAVPSLTLSPRPRSTGWERSSKELQTAVPDHAATLGKAEPQ